MAPPRPTNPDRTDALQSVRQLRVVFAAMIETLHEDIRRAAAVETALMSPLSMSEIMPNIPLAKVRSELSQLTSQLEAARKTARIEIGKLMVAGGASIDEVGRTFGISRQLASRLLRDDSPK